MISFDPDTTKKKESREKAGPSLGFLRANDNGIGKNIVQGKLGYPG